MMYQFYEQDGKETNFQIFDERDFAWIGPNRKLNSLHSWIQAKFSKSSEKVASLTFNETVEKLKEVVLMNDYNNNEQQN